MGARNKTGIIDCWMEEDTDLFTGGSKLLEDDGYILSVDGDGLVLQFGGKERTVNCGKYAAVFLNLSVDQKHCYRLIVLDAFEDVPGPPAARAWSGLVTSNGFMWRVEDGVLYITSLSKVNSPNSTEKLASSFRLQVGNSNNEADARGREKLSGKSSGHSRLSDQWEKPFSQFMALPSRKTLDALRTPAIRKEALEINGGDRDTWISLSHSAEFERHFSLTLGKPHTYFDLRTWLNKNVGIDSRADRAKFALIMRFEERFRSARSGRLEGFYLEDQ